MMTPRHLPSLASPATLIPVSDNIYKKSRLYLASELNFLSSVGKTMAGTWASKLGRTNTPKWSICVDSEGDFKGSYEYTAINGYGNNFTIKGYTDG
jgi:hypothetical protein